MDARGRLIFYYGPMGAGKSTFALQTQFNQRQRGRQGILITMRDRSGASKVTSRIGLESAAELIDDSTDVGTLITNRHEQAPLDYAIVDEAQFLTAPQVEQLAQIVDDEAVDVFTFGLLTDFRSTLFPGAARLVELADEVHRMQSIVLCWCGTPAFLNARVVDGRVVRDGDVVAVGDTTSGPVMYQALCRKHFIDGRIHR